MSELITHKTPQDFFDYNENFIYDNYFVHYHLQRTLQELRKGEIDVFDAYNIIDDKGSFVLCLWVTSSYFIYSFNWSEDILTKLVSKIEVPKFTSRFTFMGEKNIITNLFDKYNVPYTLFKDRLVYQCKEVAAPVKQKIGTSENATMRDFAELVRMSMGNYKEEYSGLGQKSFREMEMSVAQGISENKLFLLRKDNSICSVLQVINEDVETPMIGNLFTKKEMRNQGCAFSLLHTISEGLLANGSKECGLLSDATNLSSNKVFRNVGYNPIYNWASVHKSCD